MCAVLRDEMVDVASRVWMRCSWMRRVWWLVLVLVVSGCSGVGRADAVRSGDQGTAHQQVAAVVEAAHVGATGRFQIGIEFGVAGRQVLEATTLGAFDHNAGALEMVIDLDAMVGALPPGSGPLPPGFGGDMVVRIIGSEAFVHVGPDDRNWVSMPVDPEEVTESFGVYMPEQFLALLEQVGSDVSSEIELGGDGEPTVRYSGWIDSVALGALTGGDAVRLATVASAVPSQLRDRVVRFDLWVGADGVPRRLLIELDLDTVAAAARDLDGTSAGIDRLIMRFVVEWFDLGADISIEPPAPHLVTEGVPGGGLRW
jgi:hypothetical protein